MQPNAGSGIEKPLWIFSAYVVVNVLVIGLNLGHSNLFDALLVFSFNVPGTVCAGVILAQLIWRPFPWRGVVLAVMGISFLGWVNWFLFADAVSRA